MAQAFQLEPCPGRGSLPPRTRRLGTRSPFRWATTSSSKLMVFPTPGKERCWEGLTRSNRGQPEANGLSAVSDDHLFWWGVARMRTGGLKSTSARLGRGPVGKDAEAGPWTSTPTSSGMFPLVISPNIVQIGSRRARARNTWMRR